MCFRNSKVMGYKITEMGIIITTIIIKMGISIITMVISTVQHQKGIITIITMNMLNLLTLSDCQL